MKLHTFVSYHKIDIILLQEHNIKLLSSLDYLLNYYEIVLNPTINIKGGTAVMINKKLDARIISVYKDASSRICMIKVGIQGEEIDIMCVYAPSGAQSQSEREDFFETVMLPLMQNNVGRFIIGADWNCIISNKDSSEPKHSNFSNSLKQIVSVLKLKDVHNLVQRVPEYTYMRKNYAVRLDRIYMADLIANVKDSKTLAISFSDHSCFMCDVKLDNVLQIGKSYWKLNISLLEDLAVKEDFKNQWVELKRERCNYESILEWWEELAKKKVKEFYIRVGSMKKKMRYNMLNVLESRLRSLHETAHVTGNPDMIEIKRIKCRIETIRDELAEGIKIRTRMKDLQSGEKISKYLIGKQRERAVKKVMTCVRDKNGTELRSFPAIQKCFTQFYSELYTCDVGDQDTQNMFLGNLENKLDDFDREILEEDFDKLEIYHTMKRFARNRTPGIDGLPIEFYITNWDIIGNDFTEVVHFILRNKKLSSSQHKGIITLIKKDGDEKDLKNWRPISLLCVDYKIVSKLLASRMKLVMGKIIDEGQYCSVQGRSIVQCNMLIRDIMYYVNNNDKEAAFLKLDWHKAFDMVNIIFLLRIMRKVGFGDRYVGWVQMLYDNAESAICINNFIGEFFPISRSVRQGCPLSMMLYALYQEPFYVALKKDSSIVPLVLPGSSTIKAIGYADDTNILICSEDSLLEVDKIVEGFEKATGSKMNRNEK